MRLSSAIVARPEYYDRNPIAQVQSSGDVRSEGQATTTQWTYTVPAARAAMVTLARLVLLCEVASATTTTTDILYGAIRFDPIPGAVQSALWLPAHSMSISAGDLHHAEVSPMLVLAAGEALSGTDNYGGTGAGAGRVMISTGATMVEFDA